MPVIPRLLIAGTHSGVGKTTVAVGVMAALTKRGVTVQPFKAGPDYIDPTYHTAVTGRICRNLDTWLLAEPLMRGVFQHAAAGADLALVEGVMGMFDGRSAISDRGSTAELAKRLHLPVILVVDASGMARSAAALVQGYAKFDPSLRIAGVIFNRVSPSHAALLREAVARYTTVPVLGHLEADAALALPERHLGLVPAVEGHGLAGIADRLAAAVMRSVAMDRVMRIAQSASPLPPARLPGESRSPQGPRVRIGLARDPAFHFYYEENLELLQRLGAELVAFSPLADRRLPEALDALYLGGGFPEVFADGLARNAPLRRDIKRAVDGGLPTYAECGGLMYLAECLVDHQGRRHAMVGALPGTVRMTNRLQHFGYAQLIPARKTILAAAADSIKGHEFHYSVWDHAVPRRHAAYVVAKPGRRQRQEGFSQRNLLASYIHVHFLTNPRWARGFVASAQRWKGAREGRI